LKYQQVFPPLLSPAIRPDGTPILRTHDRRLPYQAILRDPPDDAITIAMFGGSAMAGLGFSPNVTIARHLERMLRRAFPDRVVQVLNFGIVALSSKQVKVLVADVCKRYDVDLVVVYSGNNEFLEIHAEKYAQAHASWATRLGDPLAQTNLYRLANRALRGLTRQPSLAAQDLSQEDLRLTQRAIVQDIEMTEAEKDGVVRGYRANREEVADAATVSGTPLILMSVASNWKWHGREDLPVNWLDDLLGAAVAAGPEREARASERIAQELASSPPSERHEWLFRRAVLAESLGDFEAARSSYRAAFNEDPHLRRALDAMNEQVARVALRPGVEFVDTVAFLAQRATNGIVGFDEFYDYVHFTPRGAVLVAEELFDSIRRAGILPIPSSFDAAEYAREEIEWLANLVEDEFAVDRWIGFGFDRSQIADRDLWKYDRLSQEFDGRIEKDPEDVSALVYRGNASYFRIDGAAAAARDYRAAIELAPGERSIRANLDRLLAERAP
jgi:tetratricopeptide (TPR) repeat protein